MNTAAFFDIDGTLYREGLITEVFKKFVKSEIIPADKWYKDVKPDYDKWDRRQGDYDNYLLKMAEIYIEAVKGLHKSQVEFIAKNVIMQKGDRVYTYTRDRIKFHKDQGHKLIIISGSPRELVREMAKKYEFDDYIGSIYCRNENNIYTGEVIPMWDGESKKKAIMSMGEKYDIDFNKSFAYGDTSGDFTMFNIVDNPVLVNPTKELLGKVISSPLIKEKVKIIVERKDVVYRLNPDCILYD